MKFEDLSDLIRRSFLAYLQLLEETTPGYYRRSGDPVPDGDDFLVPYVEVTANMPHRARCFADGRVMEG